MIRLFRSLAIRKQHYGFTTQLCTLPHQQLINHIALKLKEKDVKTFFDQKKQEIEKVQNQQEKEKSKVAYSELSNLFNQEQGCQFDKKQLYPKRFYQQAKQNKLFFKPTLNCTSRIFDQLFVKRSKRIYIQGNKNGKTFSLFLFKKLISDSNNKVIMIHNPVLFFLAQSLEESFNTFFGNIQDYQAGRVYLIFDHCNYLTQQIKNKFIKEQQLIKFKKLLHKTFVRIQQKADLQTVFVSNKQNEYQLFPSPIYNKQDISMLYVKAQPKQQVIIKQAGKVNKVQTQPSFDQNQFIQQFDQQEYNEIQDVGIKEKINKKNKPFSKQKQSTYEPKQQQGGYKNKKQFYQKGYKSKQQGYQGGFKQNQGGFKPNQGGFKPNQGGFKPNQGGFKQQREGYQGGFKPNQGGFKQPREGYQGGYKPNQGGYKQPREGFQGGFKPNQGGFKQPREGYQGGFKPNQGGFKQPREGYQGGFKPNQGGFKQPREGYQGGYKPNQGGYKQPREGYQGGFKPNQGGYKQPREGNQGGFKPKQQGFQGGFKQKQDGGFQRKKQGFKPRQQGFQEKKVKQQGRKQPNQNSNQNVKIIQQFINTKDEKGKIQAMASYLSVLKGKQPYKTYDENAIVQVRKRGRNVFSFKDKTTQQAVKQHIQKNNKIYNQIKKQNPQLQ